MPGLLPVDRPTDWGPGQKTRGTAQSTAASACRQTPPQSARHWLRVDSSSLRPRESRRRTWVWAAGFCTRSGSRDPPDASAGCKASLNMASGLPELHFPPTSQQGTSLSPICRGSSWCPDTVWQWTRQHKSPHRVVPRDRGEGSSWQWADSGHDVRSGRCRKRRATLIPEQTLTAGKEQDWTLQTVDRYVDRPAGRKRRWRYPCLVQPGEPTTEDAPESWGDHRVSSLDIGQKVSLELNELMNHGKEHSTYRKQSTPWFWRGERFGVFERQRGSRGVLSGVSRTWMQARKQARQQKQDLALL